MSYVEGVRKIDDVRWVHTVAMRCDAMLCYAMRRYAMLCHAMLCYAMQSYAMRCYAMRCDAMRCFFVQIVHHFFLDNDNGLPPVFYEVGLTASHRIAYSCYTYRKRSH